VTKEGATWDEFGQERTTLHLGSDSLKVPISCSFSCLNTFISLSPTKVTQVTNSHLEWALTLYYILRKQVSGYEGSEMDKCLKAK
jgi:hypothetical protein